ncbi:MAG: hypothetical protein PF513_04975 [Tenericutes bacterium]|jgi:hypothetical protein|nr:hypothetical protein [Mycoplasmatota bacterium]
MLKITKKIWIISMMVLAGLAVVSCAENPTEEPTTGDIINHSFDMDTVYYEGEGFEITYKDLYSSIIVNDGIDQLLTMIDQELLKDFLDVVTTEKVDEKRIKLTYGTTDQEEIDKIDEDRQLKMEKAYTNGMRILGYGDNDIPYLEFLVARDLYVEDLLTNPAIEDNNIYLNAEDIVDEYIKNKYGEVNAIMIRYDVKSEASQVLSDNDLVEFHGELRLYTGTTPLEDLPSYKLDEDNTRSLTTEELLSFFIQFYNDEYSNQKTLISETATYEDLLLLEDLSFQYEDLQKINTRLGNLMFSSLSTLNEDPESAYYTYKPYEVAISNENDYYLVLNLDRNYHDLSEFDGDETALKAIIGEELYNEILQDLIDRNLNDGEFINRRLKTMREDHGFEIYDYYLKLDYDNVVPEDMEATSLMESDYVIASYDDAEILVKDLMGFALERKTPLYLVHASQLQVLKTEHYDNVYCDDEGNCETDYTQNNSAAMNAHLTEFVELEQGFIESGYVDYYSFEDYLYLAYGVHNDVEMINSYIKRTLEPLFLYDYIMENKEETMTDMMTYIDSFYDNYFSINAKHILIFMDENNDGNPDNYEEFYDELEDQAAFDELIVNFKMEVINYLNANEDDLTDFVTTYRATTKDDAIWGEYKEKGLKVLTENLSSKSSLNYMNSFQKYEDTFVDGLIDVYQTYQLAENINKEFVYSNLVESSYGLHLIKAEKGDNFEMPSADFTVPADTTYNYPAGLNNDGERVNLSQLEVYMNYRIYDIASSVVNLDEIYDMERPELPTRLEDLFIFLVQPVHDGYYASAFLNTATLDYIFTGNIVDSSEYSFFTEAEMDAFLLELKEVYAYQIESQFVK